VKLNDTLIGWLLCLFAAAIVAYSRTLSSALGQHIGPAFFPYLLGGGMAAGGVTMIWSGRRQRGVQSIEWAAWTRQPRMALNGALVIGDVIFYALVVDTIGFFVTGFVFLTVLFLAFQVRLRWIAPLAIGVTLVLHFAFYTLLHVPLPWGWLEGVAW
jgi:putative tricarboxylic transport membrane protein